MPTTASRGANHPSTIASTTIAASGQRRKKKPYRSRESATSRTAAMSVSGRRPSGSRRSGAAAVASARMIAGASQSLPTGYPPDPCR